MRAGGRKQIETEWKEDEATRLKLASQQITSLTGKIRKMQLKKLLLGGNLKQKFMNMQLKYSPI